MCLFAKPDIVSPASHLLTTPTRFPSRSTRRASHRRRGSRTAAASFDQERAFAKRILIRLWEKYGANANENDRHRVHSWRWRRSTCRWLWSGRRSGAAQQDSRVRQPIAEAMAETDLEGTLAYLANDRDRYTQTFLLKLADRFVARDREKALRFADEALARVGQLSAIERPAALAATGGVLARAGRDEAGSKLIDDAVRAAAQLGIEASEAQDRAKVAAAIAPRDLEQALALVEPVRPEDKDRCLAFVARAIAKTDTARAVALADEMNSPAPMHERVKTAIAYKIGADRPDEAIRIIESLNRENARRWQAEAFGWLAVAARAARPGAGLRADRPGFGYDHRGFHHGCNVDGLRDGRGRARRRVRAANRVSRHGKRCHAGDRRPARNLARRFV